MQVITLIGLLASFDDLDAMTDVACWFMEKTGQALQSAWRVCTKVNA